MATSETDFFQIITPVTHDLGDFKVHRTLAQPRADDGRAVHLR